MVSIKEIESKSFGGFSKVETTGSDECNGVFDQVFKKEIMQVLYNLFQKIEHKKYFPIYSLRPSLP
jgi:hypothetical protein